MIKGSNSKTSKQSYIKKAADRMFAGAENMLFKRAAELRGRQTHAEEVLWGYLRTKPFGYKFGRQHPYLNYILDFYCHALHLIIEVDGCIHDKEEIKAADEIRQKQLEEHSLTILRFSNEQIEHGLEKVISKIESFLKERQSEEGTNKPKSPL